MIKEVPLKERIEKLYESGYVNEFNYLENQLQEARYLVTILHKQTEEKDQEIDRLSNIRVKALEFIYKKLIPENVNWDYDDCIYSDLPAAAIKPLVDILELKEGNEDEKNESDTL